MAARRVTVVGADRALVGEVALDSGRLTWVDRPVAGTRETVRCQVSAHGRPVAATLFRDGVGERAAARVRFDVPNGRWRRARRSPSTTPPDPDAVLGGGVAA